MKTKYHNKYSKINFKTKNKNYFRLLPMVQDNFQFKVLCFIVRGLEAIGASAFSTSSFVYVIQIFPDNVSSVLVSTYYIHYLFQRRHSTF